MAKIRKSRRSKYRKKGMPPEASRWSLLYSAVFIVPLAVMGHEVTVTVTTHLSL